jgi:hypothetical protein
MSHLCISRWTSFSVPSCSPAMAEDLASRLFLTVSWIVLLNWVSVKCIYCPAGPVSLVYYELLSLWFIIHRTGDNYIGNYHRWDRVWRTGLVAFFFLIKPTDALISQIYFFKVNLHVSGSSSAHHQEFSTVYSALVYVNKLHDIYQCRIYGGKLLMMGRGTAGDMQSFFTK